MRLQEPAPRRPAPLRLVAAVIGAGLLLGGSHAAAAADAQARTQGAAPKAAARTDPPPNRDAKVMADFRQRVDAYAELRRSVEARLPPLSKEATPAAIDTHQRAFATSLAKARSTARPGDVFTPAMQDVVRRFMARLFKSPPERRQIRDSVMDDNPGRGAVAVKINARYPDVVPLSTMPPDVLKNLPALPEPLEYRFVGETLILLDPDAHIVVDYVPRALPQ